LLWPRAARRLDGRADGGHRLPHEPDFWRLWLVGLVIFIVRWIETITMAVFTYQETDSAFMVAFVTMLRIVPMGVLGVLLGAAADRLERRTALLMIVTASLATSGTLALLARSGNLAVWHLAVASFINGIGWAADNPVRRMMIGEVVGMERMSIAISIDVGSNNASRMTGPTIGGLLMATVGIYGSFTASVVLYAIALIAAFGLRYRNQPVEQASGAILVRLLEGLKFVRASRRLRGVLVITLIFNIFGWPFTSMVPVIGQDHLQLGPGGIGLLASMDGVGAFCGALMIALFGRPAHHMRLYVGGLVMYLLCLTLFPLAPDFSLASAALIATGFGGAGFSIMQATLIYTTAPPEMRGRMFGVLATCIGIGPLGFIHIGVLADLLGARAAIAVSGIEGLLAVLLTYPVWRAMAEPEGG
jgi:MFS family permease